MLEIVRLNDDEWCYASCDGLTKAGQHLKWCGACGFVNFRLINAEDVTMIRRHLERLYLLNSDDNQTN